MIQGSCIHPLGAVVVLAHGVRWCARCGSLYGVGSSEWRTPGGVIEGPPPPDRGALLRRAIGVVNDVARLQAEAAAVLDAYAKE